MTEFEAAYNAKDAPKVASFYAEDGVLMAPNAPLVRGQNAIEATIKRQFERAGVLKVTSIESRISGDRAFSAGTFTVTISRGGSQTLAGVGGSGTLVLPAKYLTVFKRVGNAWKIAYDTQNGDQSNPQ